MTLLPLIALAALGAATPESAVRAVTAALAVPGARAEVLEVRDASRACPADRAEALRPVTASGEIPLRTFGADGQGRPCQGYVWARVRVVANGLIATRAVSPGEPLLGAVAQGEIELRSGRAAPLAELPAGGRAVHALAAGAPVLDADVSQGPLPGEPIAVVVRGGGLEISQEGRSLPCPRGRGCALLPGGRRVEGRLEDGRLVLEVP